MQIHIEKSSDKKFKILLPSGMLFGLLSTKAVAKLASKHITFEDTDITLSPEQISAFFRALNQTRKQFRHWNLVEIREKDGTYVKIKL